MNPRILIVEDDAKISELLADYCRNACYDVTQIDNGQVALDHVRTELPDLIILDLNLPGLDGLEVCKGIRGFSNVPIIMLTARVDEIDRLLGLELGADDYICKPFSPREVVARIRVQLRRLTPPTLPSMDSSAINIDKMRMRVQIGNHALNLTPVEFRILAELASHPDRVYSRQQLLDFAHEDQRDVNDRTVDSHIKNIRRKIAQYLPESDCLQSVYGVGYRFSMPD